MSADGIFTTYTTYFVVNHDKVAIICETNTKKDMNNIEQPYLHVYIREAVYS